MFIKRLKEPLLRTVKKKKKKSEAHVSPNGKKDKKHYSVFMQRNVALPGS